MKKKEIIQSGMMLLLFFGILAGVDYLVPGMDENTRLLTIFIIVIFLIPVAIKLFPSDSEEETSEKTPFLIDLTSWMIAFSFKDLIEPRLGLADTYPLFTEEKVFDGRAILSLLIFLVILMSSRVIVRKVYLVIKKYLANRRAAKKKAIYDNRKYHK